MAKLICAPRRAGKTTKLVEMARECGGLIVTANERLARVIRENYDYANAIGIESVNAHLKIRSNIPVFVDDAEAVLRRLLDINCLAGYSTSDKPEFLQFHRQYLESLAAAEEEDRKHVLGEWADQ